MVTPCSPLSCYHRFRWESAGGRCMFLRNAGNNPRVDMAPQPRTRQLASSPSWESSASQSASNLHFRTVLVPASSATVLECWRGRTAVTWYSYRVSLVFIYRHMITVWYCADLTLRSQVRIPLAAWMDESIFRCCFAQGMQGSSRRPPGLQETYGVSKRLFEEMWTERAHRA